MTRELDRIRDEYARRASDPRLRDRYSLFEPGVLFMLQTRERAALKLLRRSGIDSLDQMDVLEVGCGSGGVLLDLLRWGVRPSRLHGCELVLQRASQARNRCPARTPITVADGGNLPYCDSCFDLVAQFTVFTSVLDADLRRRIAESMWRVLRPGGAVLWYDFRYQGNNPAVAAIRPAQVGQLFPQGQMSGVRVTLAPPIARRLTRLCWWASETLSFLPWLRSHDLILIRKPE